MVRCVHGLEWLCAEEISTRLPQASGLAVARRELTFGLSGGDPGLAELAGLRTADDVFIRVGQACGAGTTKDVPPVLARELAQLPWQDRIQDVAAVRSVAPEPLFDVVVSLEGRRNYSRFVLEAAVGEALTPVLGGRYLRRTAAGREPGEADLTVRIFVREQTAIAGLRLTQDPLHRRAYKLATGPGTVHPPLAAALARLGHREGGSSLLDPFCGDGTIAIESALADPGARVLARDLDPDRLVNAQANARRAGVRIDVARADAGLLTIGNGAAAGPDRRAGIGAAVDVIVTNPPWNLTVDAQGHLAGSLDRFWDRVPELLARNGQLVLLADTGLRASKTLRGLGFGIGLAAQIRVSGRVSEIVVAVPPGQPAPVLPPEAGRWRDRLIRSGVLTATGF
jgi:tRNA (guanine6-N2)-methyltransferase